MLKSLDLRDTQITDAGCAALAAALNSGALPALKDLILFRTPASAAAKTAVHAARGRLRVWCGGGLGTLGGCSPFCCGTCCILGNQG